MSDAKFFYESDLKTKLEDRLPKFDGIVFHEKLGTQGERIDRIERLAAEIAPLLWKQRQSYFDGKRFTPRILPTSKTTSARSGARRGLQKRIC